MRRIKKEILSNIISFSVIDFLGLLIPIVTMPILTRALGADVYGQYLLFISILFFGQTLIDYGIQYVGVREVAGLSKRVDIVNSFEELQGVRWLIGIFYSTISISYAYLFLEFSQFYNLIVFGIPYIIGYIMMTSWFYQAVGKTKVLMLVTFAARISNLLIIVLFVESPEDINLVLFGSTYPILIAGGLLSRYVIGEYGGRLFSFRNISYRLHSGFNVFVGLLAPNLYNALPVIIMGSLYNSSQFALFAVGTRICGIISVIQGIISKSVFPSLARSEGSHVPILLLVNLCISTPIVSFLFFFGDELLGVFLGPEFSINPYLNVLLVGMFFLAIASSFGEGFLLPKGYDSIYRKISLQVSLSSAVISAVLIAKYELIGGAFGLTIARMLFSIYYLWAYFKIINNKAELSRGK
ncbi:hypothetical protein A3K86_13190 [Photobacterium jeanii]|uniref:Polysaccharide biosynthesis protein C-terminal domain-containing protein n=1 Tax=Photobacterium jeanii TaxID=858640 RepID=A0A178K8W1_9GAMM|nr:oligosaccharide flippase family protein [Photobacterium jeanii]OAN13537.1 hypothetical protein A3K86_13190 [Photobacterium jeanii]PST88652.1 flippase [Photobacterium jeanii]